MVQENGISERMIERHCLLRPVDVTGTTESEGLDQLLNAILDTHGIGYGYKIHLSGQMSAHAIAAYVNERVVLLSSIPISVNSTFLIRKSSANGLLTHSGVILCIIILWGWGSVLEC